MGVLYQKRRKWQCSSRNIRLFWNICILSRMSYSLQSYHYNLPKELIAQEAIHPHHNARMMCIAKKSGNITDETTFLELSKKLWKDHVIYFNDSKVLPSRLEIHDAKITNPDGVTSLLPSGEIFFLGHAWEWRFEALIKPGNKFKVWNTIEAFGVNFCVESMTESGRILKIEWGEIMDIFEAFGQLPLPPYIAYSKEKEKDYQTVFAKNRGSVAAPTASLHFTEKLLEDLLCEKQYITLHVGLWTFLGIQTEDIRDYQIHEELASVDIQIFERIASEHFNGKKRIAVGTTVCRTLESLPYLWKKVSTWVREEFSQEVQNFWDALETTWKEDDWIQSETIRKNGTIDFWTSIYITPGFKFQIVDELITNFHLPESSLLVLISSFLGYDQTMDIYKHAIAHGYRFYSFWDGMYIHTK